MQTERTNGGENIEKGYSTEGILHFLKRTQTLSFEQMEQVNGGVCGWEKAGVALAILGGLSVTGASFGFGAGVASVSFGVAYTQYMICMIEAGKNLPQSAIAVPL
jgi:hypothetical protein